ncbi:serine/threonine-protein kinase PknK [Polyangium spumosum]|uniref:Protein kinase n=1 Tax=Polyangium spumosum TaxID=889282 RepID=A0A6N7PGA5_9BACT|nr:serine/threonine-protein kinase [Polyangium spumosum]MRG91058.1 protein kinase [Polyangium spumosum]
MAMHPDQLADFEILRRLGAGGMAEVFLAKKRGAEGTYKLLVVKRVLPAHGSSRRFRSMFVEEAHLATRLNHPNIVQVYEFSDHGDDGLLLSMEYVEGFDLGKIMSTARRIGARIPPYVAAYIVSEAAKGLHYAHERKDEGGVPLCIVHRDISPQNILISYEGAVKIADFGIASANLFREEQGVLKGKFGYMSPEQARGERVDRRGDIYALGVVLYEMLALRSPYGKLDDDALLEAVKTGAFLPPSAHVADVPPELELIVTRAMRGPRELRYQTARDMSAAIMRTLLAKQELVDSASIEAMLLELFGRELELPLANPREAPEAATLAAVPLARTPSEGTNGEHPTRLAREVRHVAVVTLRIDGAAELGSTHGKGIRDTLNDIAFKRGAKWSWGPTEWSARAVVGLMANPSRAAADAATLAIDVHEALAGASEDLPTPLRASIGIVRGIASGERDPKGHLENHSLQEPADLLADRVGAATPFGKTWVAGGVYRLVRRDFRWGEAPSLTLGDTGGHRVPAQMRLYALERLLTREERMAELALGQSDLVGRDAEKADLYAAYHRAVSPPLGGVPGSPPSSEAFGAQESPSGPRTQAFDMAPLSRRTFGELVARVVVGEMGIGKTALVSTFLSELPGGARVVQVECSPVKMELPLATVADVVRDVTGMGLDNSLEEAQGALRDVFGPFARMASATREILRLAELVTGKHGDHQEEDASNYRHDLVVQGMRHLLAGLGRQQPIVVVVDGLQWADRASLELLKELLRRPEPLPILVVLVTRADERVLSFVEGLVRIELRGLEPEEQVRLVEARLGVREGVAAVCSELVSRVAGNPFFLLEMVDALLERGTLEIVERSEGRHELVRHERPGEHREALPSTLEQLIGDRLRELPLAEHDVVDWLAVAGGPLTETDILALARLPDDEAITRLCARGLCDRRAGSVDVRHPLARDVAYLALDAAKRSRMHLSLGEHLSRTPLARGLSAAIVARHLARGEAAVPAAEMYLEAAAAARATHQEQLALRYYLRALSLLPPEDPRRMTAHAALEAIYRHLGRRSERRKHLEALRKLARQSGKARSVALALVRTARLDCDDGHLARGLPVAQRATEIARIARQPALEVEAYTILAEVLGDLGDVQGAIDACERALEVTQAGKLPPRLRAEVLRSKGVLLRRIGRVEEAAMAHAEAIAVFRAVGARRSEARAKNALAYAMFVMERFEDAIALGLSSIGIDLAIGGRFQIAKTLSNVGQAYARLGDTERGLSYLKRAREAHERYADQDSRADTLLCSAEILLELDIVAEAGVMCGDAGALVAVTGSAYDTVHERIVRALLARAEGRPHEAVVHAQAARKLAEPQGLLSYHIHATAIEAAARVDAGEHHTGVLLARTALGAIEATSFSEYGIEVRALCIEALRKGSSSGARDALLRAAAHVRKVAGYIRDARLRALFLRRPVVERILSEAEGSDVSSRSDPLSRGGMA